MTPMRTRKNSSIKRTKVANIDKSQVVKILNEKDLGINEFQIKVLKKLKKLSKKIDALVPIPFLFDEGDLMECFPYFIRIKGKEFHFTDIYEFITLYEKEKDLIIKDRLRREFVQQKLNRTQRNLLENKVFDKEMQQIRKG